MQITNKNTYYFIIDKQKNSWYFVRRYCRKYFLNQFLSINTISLLACKLPPKRCRMSLSFHVQLLQENNHNSDLIILQINNTIKDNLISGVNEFNTTRSLETLNRIFIFIFFFVKFDTHNACTLTNSDNILIKNSYTPMC